MTERRSPVTWRLTPRTVLAGTALASAAFGGLLSVQVATGRDPALAAIALRETQRPVVATVPPKRRVVVRRVIITRVVTTPTGPAAAGPAAGAPTAVAPPAVAAAPVPAATPVAAPPPPVAAPPPPVVSRAS